MSMKTKGVAFNMECPHQRDLLAWASRYPNFSSYVKRLIEADRQQNQQRERQTVRPNSGGIRFKVD